jgi:deoxyribodipyrimidine photolyase
LLQVADLCATYCTRNLHALQEALDAIGEEPYVAATVDPAAFEQLVKEAGMAAH